MNWLAETYATHQNGVMETSVIRPEKTKSSVTPPSLKPSFAKGLFHGNVVSERLFPYPTPKKDQEELVSMTVDAIEKLGKDIDPNRIEEEKKIPTELLAKLKELGLFGLLIPEEYGGFGVSVASYIQILTNLGFLESSLTVTLGAHQSIGLKALLMFGNSEQKKKYLPKLATGEMIAAFGLTEPGAGSDARSLRTSAVLSPDGKHYILNGNKIWITNGGIADFFTIFARTTHVDSHGQKKERVTAFIVTRDMEGFSSGPEEKKMGLLGSSTTSLHFENVKVPVENVLGNPGEGFKIAMEVLNNGRLGLAGACSIAAKKLIQKGMEHALQRVQFGKPIAHFGLIQSKFSQLMADAFAAESMVRISAELMDRGDCDYSLETAMCKVFCTELQWRASNEMLQIAGGAGYMKEYGIEKVVRDSRIYMIWEGANEILRLFVGLAGMQGPGEQLKEVSDALRKPLRDKLKTIGVLSDFGVRWIQKRVTTPGHLKGHHKTFTKEAEFFDRLTASFAVEVEALLLKKGKKIIDDQFSVRRLADIAIDLFAIASTISHASARVEKAGAEEAKFEILLARLFIRRTRRNIVRNLRQCQKNDDTLETQIANLLYDKGVLPNIGRFEYA